jgi:hypothetical protein
MKTSVSVFDKIGSSELSTQEYAKNIAYSVAQLMQSAGISKLSVGFSSDTMSRTVKVSEYKLMDFAPDMVKRLAPAFAEGIAKIFSAAGLVSISIDTNSANDRATLHTMWDNSGMKTRVERKAPQILEPPDITDEVREISVGQDWSEMKIR